MSQSPHAFCGICNEISKSAIFYLINKGSLVAVVVATAVAVGVGIALFDFPLPEELTFKYRGSLPVAAKMDSPKTTLAVWRTLSMSLFGFTRHRMFSREVVRLRPTYNYSCVITSPLRSRPTFCSVCPRDLLIVMAQHKRKGN